MAEKTGKKTVSITLKRTRPTLPKIIIASGFKLRRDKTTRLIDILLETTSQKGERISLDPSLLQTNIQIFKQYLVRVPTVEDDAAIKEDISVTEQGTFSNILHCGHMGASAETIFGVFSLSDWIDAANTPGSREVLCYDNVVVISRPEFQKKLIAELLTMIEQSEGK
jgi:hypothetical protein